MFEKFSPKPDQEDGFSLDPDRRARQEAFLDSVQGRRTAENLGAAGGPNFDGSSPVAPRTPKERVRVKKTLHELFQEVAGRGAVTGSFSPYWLNKDFDQ